MIIQNSHYMKPNLFYIPNAFLAIVGSDSRGSPTPYLFTPLTRKMYSFPLISLVTVIEHTSCFSETNDHTTLLVSRFSTM